MAIIEVEKSVNKAPSQEDPSAWEKFKDMFTGNLRETEYSENLPELTGIFAGEDPVLTSQLILPLLTTQDNEELSQIITSKLPNVVSEKDEKGNIYLGNKNTGQIVALNKPGISKLDIMQTLGVGAAFLQRIPFLDKVGSTVLASLGKQAIKDATIEAAIEANQSAQGGEFNDSNVVLAGAGAVVPDLAVMGIKGLANKKAQAAEDALRHAESLESQRIQNPLSPEAQGYVSNAQQQQINQSIADSGKETIDAFNKSISNIPLRRPQLRPIVSEVEPNQSVLDAAEEFGLVEDLLPSHYSNNPTYRAIEQGRKSIIGSPLAAKEEKLLDKMKDISDELITTSKGMTDKGFANDEIREAMLKRIEESNLLEEQFYGNLKNKMPADAETYPNTVLDFLDKQIRDFGGEQNLPPEYAEVVKKLTYANDIPTYTHLDQIRKDVGAKIQQPSMTWNSEQKGRFKALYSVLSQDVQNEVSKRFPDMVPQLNEMNKQTQLRKAWENQADQLLGRQKNREIIPQLGRALKNLSDGRSGQFDSIIKSLPKEQQQMAIMTALNDVFTGSSRKEKALSIQGFDDWYQGLKRNPTALNRMKKFLPEETIKRMNIFSNLVHGIRKAQEKEVMTGRIQTLLKDFESPDGLLSKMFKVLSAETATTPLGMPGAGSAGAIGALLFSRQSTRGEKADRLLASPEFMKMAKDYATGKLEAENARKIAEKKLANSQRFKDWLNVLPKEEKAQYLKEIARSGLITFLLGANSSDH
jgi:hypothetical protein